MRLILLILACAWTAGAASFFVTVAGLGGEPEYEQRFASQAGELERLLSQGQQVTVITLKGKEATKERIRTVLADIARQAASGDTFALTLIGHGSFDGHEYKLNLPGPDITAEELASLLGNIPASRQLIVNMTSASGGSLGQLQREKRIVITATKSGTEKNAVVFARYWLAALEETSADTDKNEVITALEAFLYADRKTAEFYTTQNRLATEHALLEDTGTGEGVRNPSAANGQGLAAAQFPMLRIGSAQRAAADPAKRQLFLKREQLEQEIDKLKYQKAAMPSAEYQKRLTALLLELATTQEALEN